MIEICDEAGVVPNINENWHRGPGYRALRREVRRGSIGRPYYTFIFSQTQWLFSRATPPAHHEPFYSEERLIMFEFGVHHIDVLWSMFGEAERVYARTARLNSDPGLVRGTAC